MRLILLLLLLPLAALANNNNADSFLKAWEEMQANHSTVTSFKKVSDGKYHIEFRKLPYKGELLLLSYDVEDVSYHSEKSGFSKIGYVTIDMGEQLNKLADKYNRLYYQWAQDNTLYFNKNTQTWDNHSTYINALKNETTVAKPSLWARILRYWDVVFILVILYFLWATFIGNRRAKASINYQKEVTEESLKQNKEAIALQKQAIEKNLELHQKTNQLLQDILDALKKS